MNGRKMAAEMQPECTAVGELLRTWQERLAAVTRNANELSEAEFTKRIRNRLREGGYAGLTRTRGEAALDRLSALMDDYLLLARVIEEAIEAHRRGFLTSREAREDQVRALLEGPSIERPSVRVPLQQRELLGAAQQRDRLTPHDLLLAMEEAFREARDTFTGIDAAERQSVNEASELRRDHAAMTQRAEALQAAEEHPSFVELHDRQSDPLAAREAMASLRRALAAWSIRLVELEQARTAAQAGVTLARAGLAELKRLTDSRARHVDAVRLLLGDAAAASLRPTTAAPQALLTNWCDAIDHSLQRRGWRAANIGLSRFRPALDDAIATERRHIAAAEARSADADELQGRARALKAKERVLRARGSVPERCAEVRTRLEAALAPRPLDIDELRSRAAQLPGAARSEWALKHFQSQESIMSDPCTHCGGAVAEEVCEDCGRPARRAALVKATTGGIDAVDAPASDGNPTGRTRSSTRFTVNYPSRATGQSSKSATAPTRRRTGISSHTSTRRNALGGGLISLPDLPSQDPLQLLMATPEVPPAKRRCPKCEKPVNRTKGFCPSCGAGYDFVPRLQAGDVVAGKYEIKGPIAFGGLGWIYLGWDQVLTRWVVLKGLLNAGDEASAAAAVAERRYLAAVKHAKIVGIYDFVDHGNEGFIVMEYVGGVTVHELRKQRGPLPVAEAIAYVLGILPAFAYLHAQGLVYCDFKPDNMMVESGDVKLIDMGAVRKIGDPHGDIYATVGFAAPEADSNPVAVSDLYTLGRALAVLIIDFRFSSEFEHSLPSLDGQPLLADHESLYRFLLRATHLDPDERFQSADEMADQLFGVLREIVALQSGPKPVDSKVFTSDRLLQADVRTLLGAPQAASLPGLRVSLQDRAAGDVVDVLSLMKAEAQLAQLRQLVERFGDRAVEPRLRLAEVLIQNAGLMPEHRNGEIDATLTRLEASDPYDWRPHWLRGLWLLTRGLGAEAMGHFERVYFEMPGELAPRLAMGFAAETAGLHDQALAYYDRVGRVDPAQVSAHVGAARCHAALGRLGDAVAMLQRVPSHHVLRTQSQLAIGEMLLAQPDRIDGVLIRQAEAAVQSALPEGGPAHQLAGRLYALALDLARRLSWPADAQFLGQRFDEKSLRLGAEAQFRRAAREVAEDRKERLHWIGLANRVRPVTLV